MAENKPTYEQLEKRIKALVKEFNVSRVEEKMKVMASMLDVAPNSIIVHDFEGRFLYANKKTFELHGYDESEFMSLSLHEIDVPESAVKIAERMAIIVEKGEGSFEVAHFRKDKSILPLQVFVAKVNWNGIPAILSIATDITERKKFQEEIQLSEEKFQKAFKHNCVLMAISTVDEGVFLDVNDVFLSTLGYTRKEVIGKSSTALRIFADKNQRGKIIRSLKKSGYAHGNEVRIFTKSERVLTGLFSADIIKLKTGPVLLTQMVDITERKNAESALIASEIKFKNIINASPMGMHLYELHKDGNLFFVGANPAANQILGVDYSRSFGKTIEEVFPGLIGTEIPVRYREAALHGTMWRTEQVDYKDGEISGAFDIFAFQTEPGKMVALFNEVTQRKHTQEELMKAKEKAEESDHLKTAFLQNMSHEIRTPMNAITGFANLLNNPGLPDEKRQNYTSIIIHSSNQLLSIVNDILTISAIDTQQEKVNIERVCVNQVIADLLTIFRQRAVNRKVTITSKLSLSDKQSEIYTDITKLNQILANLLTNALKFTQEGIIEFGYQLKGKELEFYVKDNGIGIKAEAQDKIFERFRQADMLTNKKYGGTGLGLAISKAFTELLGGRIWVNSKIGRGSTFFFTVPYEPASDQKAVDRSTKMNHKKTTILIAEDEEFNILYLEELLQDLNLKIVHTKDGKETVEMCRCDPGIGLILMDIKMPVMDGHEAAIAIKKFRPTLPIIAQSAYALDPEIREYKKSGFDDFIAKPIVKDELIEKVLKFIA